MTCLKALSKNNENSEIKELEKLAQSYQLQHLAWQSYEMLLSIHHYVILIAGI